MLKPQARRPRRHGRGLGAGEGEARRLTAGASARRRRRWPENCSPSRTRGVAYNRVDPCRVMRPRAPARRPRATSCAAPPIDDPERLHPDAARARRHRRRDRPLRAAEEGRRQLRQACCPFHSEKTPSFTVSPTKQFYHCFGCGAHGTAIGFLMEYARQVVSRGGRGARPRCRPRGAARRARRASAERREEAADLTELLLDGRASSTARSCKDAPRAIDYLKGRGLTGEIAARFGIGYAPDGWQPLAGVVPDYDDPALEAGGPRHHRRRRQALRPLPRPRHVPDPRQPRPRHRLRRPRDRHAASPSTSTRPETPLFSKGRELYGLYLARNAIRDAGQVVVVEGYMDVVALAQHGVEYAVATLGTATTPVHVQKLFRLTDNVVFCFDGDAAGRKAAWRALENALPVLADGKNARFLFLPDGEDPDDFVRAARQGGVRGGARRAPCRCPSSCSPSSRRGIRRRPPKAAPRWSRPRGRCWRQIDAPVLAALLRKRLAGARRACPRPRCAALLAAGDAAGRTPARDRAPARAPPAPRASAPVPARRRRWRAQLIRGLLLQPDAGAHASSCPRPDDAHAGGRGAARRWSAHCAARRATRHDRRRRCSASPARRTSRVLRRGAGRRPRTTGSTAEHAEPSCAEGVARWWQQARRSGRRRRRRRRRRRGTVDEERERLRQLECVRRARPGATAVRTGASKR